MLQQRLVERDGPAETVVEDDAGRLLPVGEVRRHHNQTVFRLRVEFDAAGRAQG